ncbi:hypothetical protein [uncultured Rhodoblastus sp.]|uniref:hypothetical protein n=1 Tax=uncultured Rhodoblastus sp. TaxID=543037 RepID=UPI0025FC5B2E|nr:hypothetical protein [uncultured Rhodoblastus sp.]
MIDLQAIEGAFRTLQLHFPEINRDLSERRDTLDDEVVVNLLEGYALVDRWIEQGVDLFAMGNLHYWLDLNATVLCGLQGAEDALHRRLLEATEQRFYEQPDGGISEIVGWHGRAEGKDVWRRCAGVFIRILSEPQLFIEGNHRTGALIMSYILAREGRPPFVLTENNARAFFNPASVFKKSSKRNFVMRVKMPGLTRAFAGFLEGQANGAFLAKAEAPGKSADAAAVPAH